MTSVRFGLCAALILGLSACSHTVPVRAGSMVPAATAQVKMSKDDHNNVGISLEVEHLAPPKKLTPPKSVYVVWAQTPEGRNFLLGRLSLSDEGAAEYSGVAPVEHFRLLVTAEDSHTAQQPSTHVVLSTEYTTVE